MQPTLWDNGKVSEVVPAPKRLAENDKNAVFGKFIRSLRTTHRNAVLFTLCMDLSNFFQGDKLILETDSEAVYKALSRAENAAFVAGVLQEFGVTEYELRMKKKAESGFEKAFNELKRNFDGIDIETK